MNITRRQFIKTGSYAIAGSMFLLSCKANYPGYYFFTKEEGDCIVAMCEHIIPADKDPGATDAGVIHYIDKQLVSYFKDQQNLYRIGIAAVQKTSYGLYSKLFQELNNEIQLEFLKKMESGAFTGEVWKEIPSEIFFSAVVSHTMQGFYGPARHGGNKDYVSYTMMGLVYPQVVGQNRYRELD